MELTEKKTTLETPNDLSGIFGEPSEKTEEKIANALFDCKNDLQTKTQLNSPLRWSTLQMIESILIKNELLLSNNRLKDWIYNAMRNLISDARKGRSEFISVIEALAQKEKNKLPTPAKWS